MTPRPATWPQVEVLSAARRAAAGNASAFETWLREQQRLGGARENAALLAAMNSQLRDEAIADYRHAYPEREHLIADLLRWT